MIDTSRRRLILSGALVLAGRRLARADQAVQSPDAALPRITVYKRPGCGCCEKWIEHLRAAGFEVTAKNSSNLDALRRELGVPPKLAGCHTATVGDYVVEGHVPAAHVRRLLDERPALAGISVPGMPVGSPGMESPGGSEYKVFGWGRDGSISLVSTEQPVAR